MSHTRRICECGIVFNQCRCIGPHTVVILSPCPHVIAPQVTSDPINYDTLLAAKQKVEAMGQEANLLRCHASVYNAIRLYFDNKEVEDMIAGVTKPELPKSYLGELFGVDIYIDKKMKPGEWRFEKRFYD